MLRTHKAELLFNGKSIAVDSHTGRTGLNIHNNTYFFTIPQTQYKKGLWILRVIAQADHRGEEKLGSFTPDSSGILLFEDSQAINSPESAFVGTWEYRHNGDIHQRIFTADHRAQYVFNGEKLNIYGNASWNVKNGILTLIIPATNDDEGFIEHHLLRNDKELIFVNQPYRNALKVENSSK